MKSIITTEKAPAAIGPYSQGVNADGLVFVSGQLPLVPGEGRLAEGIENQAKQALANLKAIIESQSLTMAHIVKTTVFLTDLQDFATVNRVYADYFTADPPARSTIQVAALPMGAAIEIEAVAKV